MAPSLKNGFVYAQIMSIDGTVPRSSETNPLDVADPNDFTKTIEEANIMESFMLRLTELERNIVNARLEGRTGLAIRRIYRIPRKKMANLMISIKDKMLEQQGENPETRQAKIITLLLAISHRPSPLEVQREYREIFGAKEAASVQVDHIYKTIQKVCGK